MCIFLFLYPPLPHITLGYNRLSSSPISFWDASLFFSEGSITEEVQHSFVGFQLRHETRPLQQHQAFQLLREVEVGFLVLLCWFNIPSRFLCQDPKLPVGELLVNHGDVCSIN